MSDVDIIVVDLDGGELLERCIRSIYQQTRRARLIVVDNGSSSPVRERIQLPPESTLLRSETNRGFTGGINLGMQSVTAPFVAWINNDVELEHTWLERTLSAIESSNRFAAAQSWVVAPDRITIDGAGIDISNGTYRQIGHGSTAHPSGSPWGVSATAALYRHEALRSVSRSDAVLHPQFFAYYEDVELSARLRAAGWEFVAVAEPLAVHAQSQSAAAIGKRAAWLRVRNRYYVRRLHTGVGRHRALLREDAGSMFRALTSGAVTDAFRTAAAVVAGCITPLQHIGTASG